MAVTASDAGRNAAKKTGRKALVASSFGAVSASYQEAAMLQRLAANRLALRLEGLLNCSVAGLAERPRVLEVGCGTGFLTRALRQRIKGGQWIISDIAPPMAASCRRLLGYPEGAHFVVMDAERPAVAASFDLICSNLAFQWLDNLEASIQLLAKLLTPMGRLAFSTLAEGSLDEWRQAHLELGLDPPTPAYPGPKALGAMLDGGTLEVEDIVQEYPSAHAFVAALKAIGANVPAPGRRPLPSGTLRRVLRRLDGQGGFRVTYRVAYGIHTREQP